MSSPRTNLEQSRSVSNDSKAINSSDHILESKLRPATMALAEEFMNMDIVIDRPLDKNHLSWLAETVNSGKVIPFYWRDCYCFDDKQVYRVDGKHSSTLMATGRIPVIGNVTVEHYVVQTREEVGQLWSLFDSAKSGRKKPHVIEATRKLNPVLSDIPMTLANALASGLGIVYYGHGYCTTVCYQSLAEIVLKHSDFAHWCNSLLPSTKVFSKTGVIYAAWVTYNVDRDKAFKFWKEVVTCEGLTAKSPSLVLHHRLYSTKSSKGKEKDYRHWHDFANLSLRAWQAWMKGEKITQILLTDKTSGMRGLDRFITQDKTGRILSFQPTAKIYTDEA